MELCSRRDELNLDCCVAAIEIRTDHRDSFAANAALAVPRWAATPQVQAATSTRVRSFQPRPHLRNGGAIRAFALVNTETTMPFSLSSYLLGVGTVVGALGFGFGGGVLLTKTAMKDTPVAETRVERVKRADSPSPSAPLQPVETVEKATPSAPPPAEPAAPAAGPAPPVQASTEPPKTETPKPIAEAPTPAEPATAAELPPHTEPVKPAEQSSKYAEQREAELRKAEARTIERQQRDAERKAKAMAMSRAKQRQFEEQPEPSRPE